MRDKIDVLCDREHDYLSSRFYESMYGHCSVAEKGLVVGIVASKASVA
jgi:hypothetical protein